MGLRLLAGRLGAKGDVQPTAIRVRRLRQNGDPCLLRHQDGQGHAAKPRLVGLQDGRTAAEHCGPHENDQANGQATAQASRLRAASRRCLARLPQTSISHHRRRLFLLRS